MATKVATAEIGKTKTVVKEEPKKEEAKVAGRRGFGNMKWKPEQVITLLVDYNPKRASWEAHARLENYEDGMTVEDAIKAGLTSGDLNWDAEHELIKIDEELDEDAEKKSKPVKAAKAEDEDEPEPTKPAAKKSKGRKKAEVEPEEDC